MIAEDIRPGYRAVMILLALVVVLFAIFAFPPDTEGSWSVSGSKLSHNLTDIDALVIPDKCLTQNQKAVNCGRLEALLPTGSGSSFYSLYVSTTSDKNRL